MTLLHELPDFNDLLAVVGDIRKIDPGLVEKDDWIMHSLWGPQQLKHRLELKGGTSLSQRASACTQRPECFRRPLPEGSNRREVQDGCASVRNRDPGAVAGSPV